MKPETQICRMPITIINTKANRNLPIGTMRKMNEEDKQKIMQQVELFRREKLTLDSEVAKWDDTGNDIIYMAKHMCMIMMEMTDFTRGRGPLKTTMDVINATKKISESGTKLDKLTREIADQMSGKFHEKGSAGISAAYRSILPPDPDHVQGQSECAKHQRLADSVRESYEFRRLHG
ncbi:catenin alpha-like [Uranotaenia lowii]|uniref:catenin alpha-like n=1 Tax=Uranotaenia lowii TaxID=190385 RepID=UPI00247B2087|nr:catenin alpha-like [Uranotaenia lowii]